MNHTPQDLALLKLKFFITGGTICKCYNEISGALEFRDSFIPEMLERGRCKLDYSTEQLMLKDSLEINDEDRETILASCSACEESKIIISHGTDSMVDTARVLGQKLENKTVVFSRFKSLPRLLSDQPFGYLAKKVYDVWLMSNSSCLSPLLCPLSSVMDGRISTRLVCGNNGVANGIRRRPAYITQRSDLVRQGS